MDFSSISCLKPCCMAWINKKLYLKFILALVPYFFIYTHSFQNLKETLTSLFCCFCSEIITIIPIIPYIWVYIHPSIHTHTHTHTHTHSHPDKIYLHVFPKRSRRAPKILKWLCVGPFLNQSMKQGVQYPDWSGHVSTPFPELIGGVSPTWTTQTGREG